jgi:hypothetical protein
MRGEARSFSCAEAIGILEGPPDKLPIFLGRLNGGYPGLKRRLGFHAHTVTVTDHTARNGRNPIPRNHNSNQIEGISSGNRNHLPGWWKLARGTKRLDCDRKCELLAKKTIHKAAAADLPASFQAPKRDLQFPPFRKIALAGQQVAKYHAVALQQHPAGGLYSSVAFDG